MKKEYEVKIPKRSVEEPKQSNPIFNVGKLVCPCVETPTQGKIRNIMDSMKDLLLYKNKKLR